jgi:hypothetical protein
MKAGIAVDDYKLPVFRKRLTEAGFEYTDAGELTPNVTLLCVVTDDIAKLNLVVQRCQNECARMKSHDEG